MKELKTMSEYQLLSMAYEILLRNIEHQENKNERAKKEIGRDNCICQNRLKIYNEQLAEISERILEIEHNNKESRN
ncbi:hypothetical protein DW050_11205 [Ruminococcus sp. AF42-10]|nr:hypothetical protein [Ruminococcus sp. AF42-10]RGF38995.1 hypothetical protein DW050_11205 [Ruminococcus sp. AF42-10]